MRVTRYSQLGAPKLFRATSRWSWWTDFLLVLALGAVLTWPLFQLKYSDKWASIESTFISDARFLHKHWPHPRWQPNWYTGTRFDYIYPPALRYGTAGLMKAYRKLSPPQAYHIYVGVFYCFGLAGVYLLCRTGSGSRWAALLAAFAVATVSPSFLLIPDIRQDAMNNYWEPQRLGVLVRYGEGPHMSAVAVLGFALAACFRALLSGRLGWLAAAAVSCALVVSNNFYGATALALSFPVVLWSCWITHRDNRMFLRAAILVALSWGLAAFWLVPSYLQVTLENLRFVSQRGNRWSLWVFLILAIVYMKLTERWAEGQPDKLWPVFLWGANLQFFLNVIGNYYLQFRIVGEPTRMVPELDLFLLLAFAELARRLWLGLPPFAWWTWPRLRAVACLALVLVCLSPGRKYIRNAWKPYVPYPDYQQRVEYRVTNWLAKNMPDSRSYTTGTVRFWFNAWHDLAQLGGGSEQGLLNPVSMPATWHLGLSPDGEEGIVWLQCTGVDAAIVHDASSEEHYHDIQHPKKWEGLMPLVWQDGKGNFIYQVPRRYRSLARVVDAAKLDALGPLPEDPPMVHLRQLADLLERGPEAPTTTRWEGTDRLRVKAKLAPGQTLFIQVSYDSPWRAWSGGRQYPVRKAQLGFMRVDLPAGEHDLLLEFPLPLENRIGRILTLLTLVTIGAMLLYGRRTI
ncbi:MAG: hypothetical protein NZV14_01340 [Bryobacteraceae bacterium]|nr:hypothetical protein [Bryobacteraceae bacterium]MDW8376773.1 hypothetical protein [Bryobacterales bacterium]